MIIRDQPNYHYGNNSLCCFYISQSIAYGVFLSLNYQTFFLGIPFHGKSSYVLWLFNKLSCKRFQSIIQCNTISFIISMHPASILYKSIAGRYRPVSYPDGPITVRYRFIKNAYWVLSKLCKLCLLHKKALTASKRSSGAS